MDQGAPKFDKLELKLMIWRSGVANKAHGLEKSWTLVQYNIGLSGAAKRPLRANP
jgi:hypothetical protein